MKTRSVSLETALINTRNELASAKWMSNNKEDQGFDMKTPSLRTVNFRHLNIRVWIDLML